MLKQDEVTHVKTERTHQAVLHGPDVRPQAAVRGGQRGLHAWLHLVQRHGEAGEVVHLGREGLRVREDCRGGRESVNIST